MIVMKITGLLPESMLQTTILMALMPLMLQPTTMVQAEVLVGLEEVEVALEEVWMAEAEVPEAGVQAEAEVLAEEAEALLELKDPILYQFKQ